jgi:4-azaleucine resistance transporter AzlC
VEPTPRSVRHASLTLGAAVGVIGVSFGVVAVGAGLSVPMACAMSLFVFTGATQFAAVGVIASGGSPIAAIGTGLLLGVRHIGYGLALRRTVRGPLARRLLASQILIDESTAMALGQRDRDVGDRAFWWAGLSVFVAWNLGTAAGAAFGDAIGDPNELGLDAVFPAAFLALLAPSLRDPRRRVVGGLGAVVALALVSFTPAGVPIIAAGAIAVAAMLAARGSGEPDAAPAP